MNKYGLGKFLSIVICFLMVASLSSCATADKGTRKKAQLDQLQKRFEWWPTDAKPGPVKDNRGGYWWWPSLPGEKKPWGNRGYVYLYKIIFDYKAEELPAAKPKEMRPSLLVRNIIKNVKLYFDYDKADLRADATKILEDALRLLNKNPQADILITGNCDIRGTEKYNEKLGRRRAETVRKYMLDNGIAEARIKIVSRGKLDAIAPVTDLVGMQKDRNAQFMIAEVEEIMLPAPEAAITAGAKQVEEGKFVEEKQETVEGEVKVSTKDYTVKKGDSLWTIAEKELGSGHRWRYLYELNKNKIKDPGKLKAGTKIVIPVE